MAKDDILERRRTLAHGRWKRRTRDLAWYALLAEVFFLALSPTAATTFMLISVLATLARLRIDETFSFRHLPFDVPAVLFVLLAGASVLVSPDRGFSFYNYYHLVGTYALTYFLVGQNVRTARDLQCVLATLACSAVLVVLYGYYQFAFGIDITAMRWVDGNAFPELRKRVFSTWENPNILAGYLDICICLAFGLLMHGGTRAKRILLSIAILALVLCLCMTYARGALLVMAVILAGYGILRDRRVLIVCFAVGGILLAVDPILYERLASVFTKVDTSTEMRLAFWESTLQMIQDHPFMGIGWGAYYMVYPAYDFYMQGANILVVHAHNIYLNYMAEIGIPGAAAFFWFFFGTMDEAFRFVFHAPIPTAPMATPFSYTDAPVDEELQRVERTVRPSEEESSSWWSDFLCWEEHRFLGGLSLGAGLAFLSIALNGLTDDLLFNLPSSILLWLLAAIVASLWHIYHETYAARAEAARAMALERARREAERIEIPIEAEEKEDPVQVERRVEQAIGAQAEPEEKEENEAEHTDESHEEALAGDALEMEQEAAPSGVKNTEEQEIQPAQDLGKQEEPKESEVHEAHEGQIQQEVIQHEGAKQHIKGDH